MGDDGTTSPFAFVIAGAVVIASVATALVTTTETAASAADEDDSSIDLRAEAVLDRWLSPAGVAWDEDDDGSIRFTADSGGLDWNAVEIMRGPSIGKDGANHLFDYEEAREGLGLPAVRGDVHLRIQPVLAAGGLPDLSQMRAAYIGDWDHLASVSVPVGADEDMIEATQAGLNLSLGAATLRERGLLDALGVQFIDRVHLTASYPLALVDVGITPTPLEGLLDAGLLEGDVYPDIAEYMDGVIPSRLALYDVIIIGSGVDHEEIDDADLGGAIQAYVEGGGAIVVFGTGDDRLDWTDDVLDDGKVTADRIATSPDHAHPLLHLPNDLAWDEYPAVRGWDLSAVGGVNVKDRSDLFQIVLGGPADADLAVSRDGALGSGWILFTGFRPGALADKVSPGEASDLMENILSYFDKKDVIVGIGATRPDDVRIGSAQRMTHYTDPVEGQHVLRITLLYWEQ